MHKIQHDLPTKLWCGLAALSAMTGKPTSECKTAIQNARHNTKPVRGVTTGEILGALRYMGKQAYFSRMLVPQHFGDWLDDRPHQCVIQPIITVFKDHVAVVDGLIFTDNRNEHIPVWSAPLLGQRLISIITLKELSWISHSPLN